ncbi:MAG: DegT/DnrJ/EryC1/StrS family aminotransferase [Deltaproteobacteria bacterium]|nr:DegT/DnrJ/EryC1/StrS family aminotransferase [Deltaproteobacteria bacterium]
MKVRYSYLPQQFENPEEILEEIRRHLKTCNFTLGPEVDQFEKSFAQLIGTKFAIGVGSGTDALKLALKAIGIGHGDEVITAANTFIATAGAINELGARPVFVDVTPYYTIDATKIEKAITKKTKAILPVHLTGEAADMTPIMQLASKHDLPVVEDACQAIGAAYDGQNAGTHGAAGGFSLHPLKNLNVWGDAGVIVTNSESMNEKLRLLRNHGLATRDEIHLFGYNSRLDSIQAIVGNWIIRQTKDITARRIHNASIYDEMLGTLRTKVKIAPRRKEARRVFHLYMFEVVEEKDREPLYRYLHENGVDAKIHYPIPLFLQKGLSHLGYKPGDFPETERQAKHIITLPVDQHLTETEIRYCAKTVQNFFERR